MLRWHPARSRSITSGKVKQMDTSLEQVTMRKVVWRLVPFLCLLYIIAFIIRINVGFASLTMGPDLGLSAEMLGWGAGLFFISYFFFEVEVDSEVCGDAAGFAPSCRAGQRLQFAA